MDWLAFTIAFFSAALTPGLNMLTALAAGLNAGYKRALLFILSSTISLAAIVIFCGLGIDYIVTNLPAFFDVLRIVGSIYLLVISCKILCAKNRQIDTPDIDVSKKALIFQGFASSFGDPLIWGYILSILPKFMDVRDPLNSQFFAFVVIICAIEFISTNIYAIGGSGVKAFFVKFESLLQKISACIFAALGIWMFAEIFA